MAITQITTAALSATLFSDTANAATVVAVKATAPTVYYIEADNTANAAKTYLKMWDATTGSVTLGTTAPDFVIMLPVSTKVIVPLPTALVFSTALSIASVTTAGTAGTTAPTTPITVRIAYT